MYPRICVKYSKSNVFIISAVGFGIDFCDKQMKNYTFSIVKKAYFNEMGNLIN